MERGGSIPCSDLCNCASLAPAPCCTADLPKHDSMLPHSRPLPPACRPGPLSGAEHTRCGRVRARLPAATAAGGAQQAAHSAGAGGRNGDHGRARWVWGAGWGYMCGQAGGCQLDKRLGIEVRAWPGARGKSGRRGAEQHWCRLGACLEIKYLGCSVQRVPPFCHARRLFCWACLTFCRPRLTSPRLLLLPFAAGACAGRPHALPLPGGGPHQGVLGEFWERASGGAG